MGAVGWMRLAVAGAALLAAGCSGKREPLTERDIAGVVVLESYELDLTWGYRLRGMYIVGDGTVWAFDYQGPPFYPEKLARGKLTARDMLTRHKNATRIGTVDRRGLLDMAQLIAPAAEGKVVRAAAGGQASGRLDVAWQYDREKSSYTEIILAGAGDRAATNAAPEAQALLDYLREVERAVDWHW